MEEYGELLIRANQGHTVAGDRISSVQTMSRSRCIFLFVMLSKELHPGEYSACRACKLVTPLVKLFVEQKHHCIACYL